MELFDHQKDALQASSAMNRVAYYWDMGLGKTFVGAEKLMWLGEHMNLVVCQKSKVDDWINHFLTNYMNKVVVCDLTRWNKQNWEWFEQHPNMEESTKIQILVINYELVWRRKQLKALHGFTLLLDESSLIQNDEAKRTKFLLNLFPANVILLSGTPVSGKYENLWSQVHLLGWNISKQTYNIQYVNWEKVEMNGVPIRRVNKEEPYKHVDRLKRKLRDYGAFFLKTEECFSLPQQTFVPVYVNTSKEYSRFRKRKVVMIGNTTLIGNHITKEYLYSRQLCGHFNKEKLQAFADLIQSTNDRLIVFYNFNAELDVLKTIVQEAGKPISEVNGTTKDLTAYEEQENSVTLIQYQAGAMGLNLQKANKIIYFTLTNRSELFEQSKKRIHRIGQNQPCFYYLMLCRNSVEELMLQTLEQRRDFTDELFRRCNQ